MRAKSLRTLTCITTLASTAAVMGCVSDRPSRNQVSNDQQYVRKDFLVRSGTGGSNDVDPGWFVKATIVQTSTPNPLANAQLFQGAESSAANPGGAFVHFNITEDKLQLINNLELTNDPSVSYQNQTTGEVVNAWQAQSVDLQYQVNLDGEKSNAFITNTELDWQQRQWVQLTFDKNDFSDLVPFGNNVTQAISKCAASDVSTTFVPNSFIVDTDNDYMEFTTNVTMTINPFSLTSTDTTVQTCAQLFGQTGLDFTALGRNNVSLNVKYSFVRPDVLEPPSIPYTPMAFQEKDAIQHKYGVFQIDPIFRDYQSGLMGANQLAQRWNPNGNDSEGNITYYFTPGMPAQYETFFQTTVANETNAIFAKAGAKAKVRFLRWNDLNKYGDGQGPVRSLGDVRYSFVNWHNDLDIGPDRLAGVAQSLVDPRSGQQLTASLNAWAYSIQDAVVNRLDFYLQTLGEDPTVAPSSSSCTGGSTLPLVPASVIGTHDASSTVFARMQTYLGKPPSQYGNLGPSDFVVDQTQTVDFLPALSTIVPYNVYSDPNANPFVTPTSGQSIYNASSQWDALSAVAQFNQLAYSLQGGTTAPYAVDDSANLYLNSTNFTAQWNAGVQAVNQQAYMSAFSHGSAQFEPLQDATYINVFQKAGLQCVANANSTTPVAFGATGVWQNYAAYQQGLVDSIYEETVLHEFGHTLGLRHNFMGSLDQANYLMQNDPATGLATPGLYSSSVMDYNSVASAAYFSGQYKSSDGTVISSGGPGWGPYDIAAIGFIYGNAGSPTAAQYAQFNINSYSGQAVDASTGATAPWADPFGVVKGSNNQYSENIFLYCSDEHIKNTPLCRQFDLGARPSEIVANAIDNYEWQYYWTNFRKYRKFWDQANYASNVGGFMGDLTRWSTLWVIDWNLQSLITNYAHLNINPPAGMNNADFLIQLSNAFESEISMANQMVASFYNAVVNQASGERPYETTYDPFFGDVTQQGIFIDKQSAVTSLFSTFRADLNGDPTQGQNYYINPYSLSPGTQDPAYQAVGELAVENLAGAGYATFPDYRFNAVSLLAQTTQESTFSGRTELRDWVGGFYFTDIQYFLDYLRNIAAQSANATAWGCTTYNAASCTWDPRQYQPGQNATCPASTLTCPQYINYSSNTNEFVGPDGRNYIWAYIPDRNTYMLADRDRNPVTYAAMRAYTVDLVQNGDDGTNGTLVYEYTMKAILDYFVANNTSLVGSSTSTSGSSGSSGDN